MIWLEELESDEQPKSAWEDFLAKVKPFVEYLREKTNKFLERVRPHWAKILLTLLIVFILAWFLFFAVKPAKLFVEVRDAQTNEFINGAVVSVWEGEWKARNCFLFICREVPDEIATAGIAELDVPSETDLLVEVKVLGHVTGEESIRLFSEETRTISVWLSKG